MSKVVDSRPPDSAPRTHADHRPASVDADPASSERRLSPFGRLQSLFSGASDSNGTGTSAGGRTAVGPDNAADPIRSSLEKRLNEVVAAREKWEAIYTLLQDSSPKADQPAPDPPPAPVVAAPPVTAAPSDAERIRSLEARLDEQLEKTLAVRNELREALDAHRAQQEAWERRRRDLEARVRELEASAPRADELELALESAGRAVTDAEARHQADRTAWEAAQSELRELRGLASAKAHLEARLTQIQHDLDDARARHTSDEAAWNEARITLQHELADVRDRVYSDAEAHAMAAQAWDTTRHQLEADLAARQADAEAAERARATLEAALEVLEMQRADSLRQIQRLSEDAAALRVQLSALSDSGQLGAIEARLRRACRVEQVGALAASIAPDLESLLTAIGEQSARLVETRSALPARESIDVIRSNADDALALVRQLQAFSRRQTQPLAAIDVDAAVTRAEPMLARLAGGEIKLRLAAGEARASIAEDDFDQLLTTLVFSARALLPTGGSLVVETTVDAGCESTMPPRLRVSAIASGFGVRPADGLSALELVARRCSAELRVAGDPGRNAVLQIEIPLATAA